MPRRRAVFHGLLIGGWAFGLMHVSGNTPGFDAFAYWSVDLADVYDGAVGDHGFFPYSPAAALVAAPFGILPWPAFVLAWASLLLAALGWLARDWRVFACFLAVPPVALELTTGNIHLLLAAAVVIGFRWPAAWSLILLTKVTPGIGLVWFVVRREWRPLAIALAATVAIAGGSFLILPDAWTEWVALLSSSNVPHELPLLDRMVAAALLVAWGARTDRAWTVVAGATLALPVLWPASGSMLIALASHRLTAATQTVPVVPAGDQDQLRLGRAAFTRAIGYLPRAASRRSA